MRRRSIFLILLIVAASLALVWGARAQTGSGFDLTWHVLSGGGGSGAMTGSNFTVTGTLGQSAIGQAAGGSFTLNQGFWVGVNGTYREFLPQVLRRFSP